MKVGRTVADWISEGQDAKGREVLRPRVIAAEAIKAGEVIEGAPVTPIYGPEPAGSVHAVHATAFAWEVPDERDVQHPELPVVTRALAHGLIGVYRHSGTPTADLRKHLSEFKVEAYALADLDEGDEVTLDYGIPERDYRLGPVDAFMRPTRHPTLRKRHDTVWRKRWLAGQKEKQEKAARRELRAAEKQLQLAEKTVRELALSASAQAVVEAECETLRQRVAELQTVAPAPRVRSRVPRGAAGSSAGRRR